MWKRPLTTPGQMPEPKSAVTKLIVLMAFDKDEESGELLPAFEAREMPDERRAVLTAKEMACRHAGVITWSREADLKLGEYGWSEAGAPASVASVGGDGDDLPHPQACRTHGLRDDEALPRV